MILFIFDFFRTMFGSGKYEGKSKERKYEEKKMKEYKNRIKFHMIFLFVASNQFYLFKLINIKIK